MAGMGLEGAYGAQGTFEGLKEWMRGQRQKVEQGQADADRTRKQRLEDQALTTDAADRERLIARQRVLDDHAETTFKNAQITFGHQEKEWADEQGARLTDDQVQDAIAQVKASDQMPDLAKVGLIISIQQDRKIPAQAWQYLRPKEPKAPHMQIAPNGQLINVDDPANLGHTFAAPREPRQGSQIPYEWIKHADGSVEQTNQRRPGDVPMNQRAEGRPVISGDANRITDIDVGLSEMGELRKTLTPGTTGALPWIASQVPKPMTGVVDMVDKAMTGGVLNVQGTQQREALIATVRQIIGKSLEGGVLRKEDEIKYAHILPTIDDLPENIASKMENLDRLLNSRRGQLLENLSSAGYDTSKFARSGGAKAPQNGVFNPATGKVEW